MADQLANDIARCNGVGSNKEGWRKGCETCLRRTAPRPERFSFFAPPEITGERCEYLIEPATD